MLQARRRRSRKDWAALVEEADRSKLPVREFCAKHNISSAGLYKWRSRLKNKSVFVPVKVVHEEADGTTSISPTTLPEAPATESKKEAPPILLPKSDLESTAASNPERASLTSADSLPEPPSQISSRFILHSGNIKIEFPIGCTSTELQLVAGALSC